MKEWFGDIARCIDKWLQRPSSTQHVDPKRVPREAIPTVYAYTRQRINFSMLLADLTEMLNHPYIFQNMFTENKQDMVWKL